MEDPTGTITLLLYWISRASIFPRSSLLGAGQLGFWEAGKGGWVNWVKGTNGVSLQATREGGGQFPSYLEGAK